MNEKESKKGITVTVYAIRKGILYFADPQGKRYKVPAKSFPFPVHIGAIFTNVTW